MRALVYEGPRVLTIRDIPEPTPAPEEVLVRVACSGICGSELSGFLGQNSLRRPPLVMGHEFAGTVAACGAEAAARFPELSAGRRVTVNPLIYCGRCRFCLDGRHNLCASRALLGAHRPGSYADMVTAPARMVVPIPDDMSMERAALTEPLACSIRAVRLGGCTTRDRVLVIGLGPIGLLALQAARAAGAAALIASDTDPDRRTMGTAVGATVLDPLADDVAARVGELTGGFGADLVIDAVGLPATRRQALLAVAPGGRVVFVGLHEDETELMINAVIRREIRMLGSFSYTPADFAEALEWLSAERVQIDPWMVKAPLEQGQAWYERLLSQPGPVSKVLLF
jgi:2-desacetyl-2-hydroxyethyl bacteriochlorophyllide A dehydrogenase